MAIKYKRFDWTYPAAHESEVKKWLKENPQIEIIQVVAYAGYGGNITTGIFYKEVDV